MRHIIKITALALLPLALGNSHARAADPTVITLSCDGTVTDTSSTPIPVDRKPKLVEKMGVVANLNERTVYFIGFITPISTADAAAINFNGNTIGPAAEVGSKPLELFDIEISHGCSYQSA